MKLQTLCRVAAKTAAEEKHVVCIVLDGIDGEIKIVSTERLLDAPFRYSVLVKVFPECANVFDEVGDPRKKEKKEKK